MRREDTLAGWRGGGGSIFEETPDTALYSIYVSTLWGRVLDPNEKWKKDNGFVAGKVGKYLLFVNCPQGEMGLEGGVNKGRKLHTFLKRGCLENCDRIL